MDPKINQFDLCHMSMSYESCEAYDAYDSFLFLNVSYHSSSLSLYYTLRATCHIWTGGKSVQKPATIKQVYPHFFLWMKPANVTQVVGQLLNLPDVGRSLVNFRMCDRFSSQPANVWQVTGQFSGFTNFIYFFWIKPANITQVVGQFDNLPDTGRSLVNFRICE